VTAALAILNGQKFWISYDGLSIRRPFDGAAPISQVFGQTSVTGSIHLGVDWVIVYEVLRAVLDGVVVSTYPYGRDVPGLSSDGSPGGYGSTVLLRHDVPGVGTIFSYSCHMSTIWVRYGDVVKAGDALGISGTTGISSGPHLHFELRRYDNATRFDSEPFIDLVIAPPDPWEEFMAELTEEQKGYLIAQATAANVDAADWLKTNKGALSPYALAATGAEFDAAHDTGAIDDGVSKGIRRMKALLVKMVGVVQPGNEPADALVRDLSRPENQ
jgi:murein DD-endopeptidase MepM/ murein hydrolase activator NlpD